MLDWHITGVAVQKVLLNKTIVQPINNEMKGQGEESTSAKFCVTMALFKTTFSRLLF